MPEKLSLLDEFLPVPTSDWESVIHADLKGADYDKKLVWKTEEGIAVRPYYRQEDLPGVDSAPGQFPFRRGVSQSWSIEQGGDIPASAVNASRWHENGATAVLELAFALSEGVERIGQGCDPASLTFVFSVGSNYFFEIAKLRAARQCWAQVVDSFGGGDGDEARMKIHARTALANKSIYDPYTNLLRATTEALSAAIGGADAITVVPARFSERLAANVQHILKEESHIDGVADPAGGSYYVEALTESIAREAWKLFQQLEAEGGFSAAQATIEKLTAGARAAKEKALSQRSKMMIGVNNYPDIQERVLDEAADLPGSSWRQARPVEEIRLRVERHAKSTGKTPKVLLLKRGDLKMKMARGTFCLNFFGCAGLDIVESGELDANADLVILCSSDPEYLDLAKEMVPRTKAPVIVAGNPKEQLEELKAAGVAGFVHILSNHTETLNDWLDCLGVKR